MHSRITRNVMSALSYSCWIFDANELNTRFVKLYGYNTRKTRTRTDYNCTSMSLYEYVLYEGVFYTLVFYCIYCTQYTRTYCIRAQ